AADLGQGLVAAAAVGLGDGDQVGVLLLLEVEDVPLADQAIAYEADADALVGAEDALPARGGEEGRGAGLPHEGAAGQRAARGGHGGGFHKGDPTRGRRPRHPTSGPAAGGGGVPI